MSKKQKVKISNKFETKFANYALSTRRIFHISTDPSYDEKVHFKDSYFGSYGTGTLFKKGMKFFLLTARHVLAIYLDKPLSNTSPFRITSHSSKSFDNTLDFLYPKKIWEIGKLIPEYDYYDFTDVVLVELFNPYFDQIIDHYIDMDKVEVIEISNYKDGGKLTDIGFSAHSNPYYYDGNNEDLPFDEQKFTSSTAYKCDMIHGILRENEFTFHFEKIDYLGIDTNGMSGGLIVVMNEVSDSRLIGMHIRGSQESDDIHFLPICEIIKAAKNYLYAPFKIIDYCYYDNLQAQTHVGGIGKEFEEYAKRLPKSKLRQNTDNPELADTDNLADYVVENKERILVNALDLAEVKGTKQNYIELLMFIYANERHREERIKAGRP
ncbi:hypothetical protein [Acinetobacter calcoaceticus]|uniref:hypothetical protein n=1 Tax=Acinetobacter calcoaceticus TaxID=471 RepID=UPI00300B7FBE